MAPQAKQETADKPIHLLGAFLTSSWMKVYCFYLNTARRILDEFDIDTYNVSSIEALEATLKVIREKVKRER
jgi:hypothetical protein